MAYELKEKQGSLFVNENKEHDKQPDWTGNVKIDGKTWRLAGWKTESRGGIEYISLAASDPNEYRRRDDGPRPSRPAGRLSEEDFQKRREEMRTRSVPKKDFADDFSDDDIPF